MKKKTDPQLEAAQRVQQQVQQLEAAFGGPDGLEAFRRAQRHVEEVEAALGMSMPDLIAWQQLVERYERWVSPDIHTAAAVEIVSILEGDTPDEDKAAEWIERHRDRMSPGLLSAIVTSAMSHARKQSSERGSDGKRAKKETLEQIAQEVLRRHPKMKKDALARFIVEAQKEAGFTAERGKQKAWSERTARRWLMGK